MNLPKSPTFLGNFCKGVKICHISSEIIFGQLLLTFCDFFLVTLVVSLCYYSSDVILLTAHLCTSSSFYMGQKTLEIDRASNIRRVVFRL